MIVRALSSCPVGCGSPLPHTHEIAEAVPCEGPRLGDAGVRDPAYPCDAYEPGEPGRGDCESDGHYLCYSDPGCRRFTFESEIGRTLRAPSAKGSPTPEET